MKNLFKISSLMFMTGVLIVGCSKNDAYDSNYTAELYQKGFENVFGKIDANQDWNMISQRSAKITVNNGTNETYTVGIYKNDPLFNSANCGLLAQGTVTDGNSVSLTFDSPSSQTKYYVGLFDSKGRSIAKLDSLTSDALNVNFGRTVATAKTRGIASTNYAQTWSDRSGGLNPAAMRTSSEYFDLNDVPYEDLLKMTDSGNTAQFHGYKYKVANGKTFTGSFALQNGILFVDGTLDLSGNDNLVFNNATLVVSSTGIVKINKKVSLTGSSKILVEAGGKITCDGTYTLELTNGGKSYNAGDITMVNGTFNNNGGDLYNCGNLNAKFLFNSTSGGKLYNFGKVIAFADDEKNAGAYNAQYINCCYMKFDHCNIGNFILTDDSRIDVTNRLFITGNNNMGNQSEINAGEIQLSNATINGPTGSNEFSIIKTGKFYIDYGTTGIFNYNVYVDWDKNNCYKYDGTPWDIKDIYNAGYVFSNNISNWSTESTSLQIIPTGDCTGTGYNPTGGGGDIPTAAPAYTFAFEDLGSTDDFDFNDVVLYVYPYTKSKRLKIVMVAAGGTLPVDINFNGKTVFTKSSTSMINTSSEKNDTTFIIDSVTVALPTGFTFSKDEYKSLFSITVNGITSIDATTEKGKAPQALIIPGKWIWPKERVSIETAYPNFSTWVTDKNNATNWYK